MLPMTMTQTGTAPKNPVILASGNLTGWTETTYSEDNQPTEILTYNESGDVQTRVQNKYKNDNLAVTVSLDGSNGKDYEEAFSYDKNGHLTKRCTRKITAAPATTIGVNHDG